MVLLIILVSGVWRMKTVVGVVDGRAGIYRSGYEKAARIDRSASLLCTPESNKERAHERLD